MRIYTNTGLTIVDSRREGTADCSGRAITGTVGGQSYEALRISARHSSNSLTHHPCGATTRQLPRNPPAQHHKDSSKKIRALPGVPWFRRAGTPACLHQRTPDRRFPSQRGTLPTWGRCNTFKQWGGLATGYENLALSYRSGLVLRPITIWLKELRDTP